MITKSSKKGSIRFAIKPANGGKLIQLAGEFNGWKPVPMKKQKDGSYVAEVALQAGSYQYKFIMDGQWVHDPDNDNAVANEFGGLNSVAQVQ